MLLKLAWRNCFRNIRRTLLMSFTVAVGAGGIFVFQAFNSGIMVANREHTVRAKYGHGQVMTKGYREQTFEKPWEHWIKESDSVKVVLEQLPDVVGVYPRVNFFALLNAGNISIGGRGVGVNAVEEAKFFNKMRLVEGEPLGDNPDGVIVGVGLAKALNVKIGDTLTVLVNTVRGSLNGLDFIVSGISQVGLKELDDSTFQVQLSRAQELLDTTQVEFFAIGLSSHLKWNQFANAAQQKFPELESYSFEVIDKVWYKQTVEWLAEQFNVIRFIILTIVVLGIFNAASTAILERAREIGMLRANGESSNDIVTLLAWEGTLVAGFGALLGLVGVVFFDFFFLPKGILMPPAPGYTFIAPVFLALSPWIAFQAFTMSVGAALGATVLAAQKVARLPIASALRSN